MKVVKRATKAAAFAAFALFISFFAACSGLAGDSSVSSSNNSSSGGSSDKIIVRGSICVSGAVPKEISNSLAAGGQSQASKSASPTVTTGADGLYYYYLVATQQDGSGRVEYGKNDAAIFSQGDNGIVYELGLTEGKWIIECGLKNKDTDAPVLKATSGTLTLSPTKSVINVNLVAAPVNQSGGKGKIYLEVQADSAVDHVNVYCPDFWDDMTPSVELVDGKYIIDIPSIPGSSDGVPAGVHQLTICFFNAENIMLYETVQDVNVLAGMTTNAWVAGGGSDYDVISDGVFTVGSTALASFKRTSLYVKAGGDPVINDGSHLAPLCTVQAAVNAIAAAPGSQKSDYKIFVSGPVTGHIKFPSALNSKASSIWIMGLSDIDSSADPAVLKGGSVSGEGGVLTEPEVIEVDTSAPIYIKGIKVTKEGTRVSRGIKISAENASVTLLEGTVITGNSVSDDKGAGVFVGAGTLNIKGATISENASNQDGGGVYASADGKVVMTSGQISKNSAVGKGGGVYVGGEAIISGGIFTGNYSNNGGALYVESGKKVNVNGAAVFTKNEAYLNGGAVCNYGEFSMSAGTIGGSESSDANTATCNFGGAVFQCGTFNVSGTAKIYSSSTEKQNDVCLFNDATVTVNAEYSGSGNSFANQMTLTPNGWSRGKVVLDGSALNETNMEYFKLLDDDWCILSDDSKGKLNADLWVAQTRISEGTGYVAGDDTNGRGTKKKPYATIQRAVTEVNMAAVTIYVSGTLTATTSEIGYGSGNLQNIPSSGVTPTSISLVGKNNAKIDANSKGAALQVDKSGTYSNKFELSIKDIELTGGFSDSVASGLYISASNVKVNLNNGVKIHGNKGGNHGGGVYNSNSGCDLYINEGAEIYENGPKDESATLYGGGIYGGDVYLKGGSVHGNSAAVGGGIYGGSIYIYSGSVYGNSATGGDGGGIYCNLASGILGGSVYGNTAAGSGGGVYCKSSFSMSDGMIGASANVDENGKKQTAQSAEGKHSNYAGSSGGGLCYSGVTNGLNITGGSIEYNYAGLSGGGINILASGSIIKGHVDYNYAGGSGAEYGGGGISISGVSDKTFTLDGATLIGNGAASRGGAIYLTKCSSGTLSVKMQGNVSIPDASEGVNDIYLGSADGYKNYVEVSGDLGTGGVVASIAPAQAANWQVIKAGDGVSLPAAASRFRAIGTGSYVSNKYVVDGGGMIRKLKTADEQKNVGNIVFKDGTALAYAGDLVLSDAMKSDAIAVIFYRGTGLNNNGDAERTLGIGLIQKKSPQQNWCLNTAKAYDKEITSIVVTGTFVSVNQYTEPFTGTLNGKDNFSKIGSALTTNDTGTDANYPAFAWAKNYSSQAGANVSGTSYSNNWYIPSIAELYEVFKQKESVNNSLGLCGVTLFGSTDYWSSSQVSGSPNCVWYITESAGTFNGWINSGKDNSRSVCVIHEF